MILYSHYNYSLTAVTTVVAMETTTIAIRNEDWTRLNNRKQPGDGFADVVNRVLDRLEGLEDQDADHTLEDDVVQKHVVDDVQEDDQDDRLRREDVRELVDDLDVPGSNERLEARREALVDLYEHLRMNESADKSELLLVLEAHDHGYTSAESFWSNVVKGKDTLQSLPGVESPDPGGGPNLWRYQA